MGLPALLVGVLVVWVFVLVLDRRRDGRQTVVLGSDGLDADLGAAIVAALERKGVAATYREEDIDEEDGGGVQRGICCQNADAEVARRVMGEMLGTSH
jgi:hypothetical protein